MFLSFSHSVVSDSFATPWTIAHQAPLSMEFLRQEYWGRLPFPFSEDLPDPGIKPVSPALASRFFTTEPPGKPLSHITPFIITSSFSPYPLCNFIFSKMIQIFLLLSSILCIIVLGFLCVLNIHVSCIIVFYPFATFRKHSMFLSFIHIDHWW